MRVAKATACGHVYVHDRRTWAIVTTDGADAVVAPVVYHNLPAARWDIPVDDIMTLYRMGMPGGQYLIRPAWMRQVPLAGHPLRGECPVWLQDALTENSIKAAKDKRFERMNVGTTKYVDPEMRIRLDSSIL